MDNIETTQPTLVEGRFARVFTGNGTWGWLPEGDDLQDRANANIDPYWLSEGRPCPIAERDVAAWAVKYEMEGGQATYVLYTSREGAKRALAAYARLASGRR